MKGFFLFDARDRVLRISDNLLRALGYEPARPPALEWRSFVVEEARHFKPPPGEAIAKTAYLKRQSGEIAEGSLRSQAIDAGVELYVAEVKLSEGEEPSDAEALQFLTTVSHELRVALNGVIGFANLLGDSSLSEEQRAILGKLQSCNVLLKGLINDILDYSRVESSKVDMSPDNLQLLGFVEEIVGLFMEQARAKGLELEVRADEAAAIEVSMPKLRVAQVLSNLVSNAIKFTSAGCIRVELRVEEAHVFIRVVDTGCGIEPESVKNLFRPFIQSNRRDATGEGSGLGLAISKNLVERMGGALRYERPEGKGSIFEVRLPLVRVEPGGAAPAEAAAVESPPAKAPRVREPKRVLVVEDNQLNADIIGHFLKDFGVEFDVVDNGQAAVDNYEDGKYDLILMDVMLPEMNGYEATERILARSRLQPPVPIIGVTAKVFRRDQLRCLDAGMVEVVHKPVDFKLLRDVLAAHLYNERRTQLEPRVHKSPASKPQSERGSSRRGAIDEAALQSYIERMRTPKTGRREVVSTALEIVDAEVDRLLDSMGRGDRKEVELRAHSLKGALALLGGRDLWELAKGLESIASDQKRPLNSVHWARLLRAAYADFKQAISDMLDASPAS